jgi:hypothetical protein
VAQTRVSGQVRGRAYGVSSQVCPPTSPQHQHPPRPSQSHNVNTDTELSLYLCLLRQGQRVAVPWAIVSLSEPARRESQGWKGIARKLAQSSKY